jgi:hypothetical protein
MKKLILVAAVASLVGCSSIQPSRTINRDSIEDISPKGKTTQVAFEESYGRVLVEFDDKGNWLRIKSVGTAPVNLSQDQAYTLAGMRAKRNIAEFLTNGIRSDKSFDGIYRATEDLDADAEKRNQITSTLRERLSVSSSTILRGAFVSYRKIDGDVAAVEIMASRKSIATSSEIRKLMGGL